jgi:hypothetical protein
MTPVPDTEIGGTVTRFNLESSPDGSAVLVVYTEMPDGTVGKGWITFEPESARALKRAAETRLR